MSRIFDPQSPATLAMLPGSTAERGVPGAGHYLRVPLPDGRTLTLQPNGIATVYAKKDDVGISTQISGSSNDHYGWAVPPEIINLVEMLGGRVVRGPKLKI